MRGLLVFTLVLLCSLVQSLPRKVKKPIKNSEGDGDYYYYDDEEEEPIPQTSFSCSDKLDGFYADIEANCRVFHYCQTVPNPDGDDEKLDRAYFCPPTTIFRQEYLTCATPSKSFNCSDSEKYYNVNENQLTTTVVPTLPALPTTSTPPVPNTSSTSTSPVPDDENSDASSSTSSTSSTTTAATDSSTPSISSNPTTPILGIHEYPFGDAPVIQQYFATFLPKIKPAWVTYQQGSTVKYFRIPQIREADISFTSLPAEPAWKKVDYNVNQLMKIYSKLSGKKI